MPLTRLRAGDVVFTVDATGTPMHLAISTAQVVGSSSGHRDSIHAAIATGRGTEIIESVGSGIRARPLAPGNYRVYCYRGMNQDGIRASAVMVAESFAAMAQSPALAHTGSYGEYNKRKAALSPFRSSGGHNATNAHTQQFGAGAKAHRRFFCSNMIFRAYAGAAEIIGLVQLPIPDSHSQLSPRDLDGLLIDAAHWHARADGQVQAHP